jgi:hypothetical protein
MHVATITITRHIAEDGDLIDYVSTEDSGGNRLSLTEALGMMRLAEDTLIRSIDDDADDEPPD